MLATPTLWNRRSMFSECATLFHYAVRAGAEHCIYWMLDRDQCPIDGTDFNGVPPIFRACRIGKETLFKKMVNLRATLDTVDRFDRTILHRLASAEGAFESLEWLASRYVEGDLPDLPPVEKRSKMYNLTALQTAVKANRPEVVKVLIDDFGCSWMSPYGKTDFTCLDVAQRMGSKQLQQVLKEADERYRLLPNTSLDEAATCAVCLTIDCDYITVDCNHSFHADCLTSWLLMDNNLICPICRNTLSEKEAAKFPRSLIKRKPTIGVC